MESCLCRHSPKNHYSFCFPRPEKEKKRSPFLSEFRDFKGKGERVGEEKKGRAGERKILNGTHINEDNSNNNSSNNKNNKNNKNNSSNSNSNSNNNNNNNNNSNNSSNNNNNNNNLFELPYENFL